MSQGSECLHAKMSVICLLITSAKLPYLICCEVDFVFFALQGRNVVAIKVKFGVEEIQN